MDNIFVGVLKVAPASCFTILGYQCIHYIKLHKVCDVDVMVPSNSVIVSFVVFDIQILSNKTVFLLSVIV